MLSSFRALLEEEAVRVANKRNGPRLWVRLDEAIVRMRRAVAIKDWDAYRKSDSAFHHAFLEESENRYLLNAYHLGAPALEALRVRLQSGLNNFRERSFNEHIEIARLLRAGEVEQHRSAGPRDGSLLSGEVGQFSGPNKVAVGRI